MHYYNEIEPFAVEWLRELISAGLLPAGDVDDRSIKDVTDGDLTGYTQCHFFCGIGGWPLALRLAGWADTAPVWTGSCPCQPFSAAGKGKGTADERHLWPEFHRLIAECRPAITFGEQVASKAGRSWFAGVRADLEALGYGVGASDLCAAGIGEKNHPFIEAARQMAEQLAGRLPTWSPVLRTFADWLGGIIVGPPHIRQRLFWVADSASNRHQSRVDQDAACEERANDGGGEAEGLWLAGIASDSDSCRLGNTISSRPQGFARDGSGGCEPRRERTEANRPVAETGDAPCGVEYAPGQRRREEGCSENAAGTPGVLASASSWSDCRIIPCRDGKARRISAQPGDEPLAHGLPSKRDDPRMGPLLARLGELGHDPKSARRILREARRNRKGRLKGYGNGVCPELTAEFVRAVMDVAAERQGTP